MGTLLLLAGVASLVNRRARLAATWLAIAVTLSVLLLYIPLMALAPTVEALNYVADTLLFAGTIWLLAQTTEGSDNRPGQKNRRDEITIERRTADARS